MIVGILIVIYALPLLIYYLYGTKNTYSGSDHYTHQLFIDLIRDNNYRFIRDWGNVLNQTRMSYPQLMHWFIAVLGDRAGLFIQRYLQLMVAAMMGLSHGLFMWYMYPYLQDSIAYSKDIYLILAALIFVLTPYSFNFNNAKNRGLSSRGLGVWLGQLFLYSVILWYFQGSYIWLIFGAVMTLLIFLINRFAFQYIFFSAPFIALCVWDGWIFVPLLGGLVLYFLFFFRTAVLYFAGEWDHKRFYYHYLADRFILRHRKSIWGDFIFEFPIRVYRWLVHKPFSVFDQWPYILNNPIIMMIVQVPFLVVALIVGDYGSIVGNHAPEMLFFYIILASLTVFFLTSFRATRFLGEPERYIEFSLPIIAMMIPMRVVNEWVIYIVLGYCLLRIIGMVYTYLSRVTKSGDTEALLTVRDRFLKESEQADLRILSTHTQDKKIIRNAKLKMFDFILQIAVSDGLRIEKVYSDDYDLMNFEWIPEIVKRYELNTLLTRPSSIDEVTALLEQEGIRLEPWFQQDQLLVYKIIA